MRTPGSQDERPGSASQLQKSLDRSRSRNQDRNRFFGPHGQRSGNDANHSRSLSQERAPQQHHHHRNDHHRQDQDLFAPGQQPNRAPNNNPGHSFGPNGPRNNQRSRSPMRKQSNQALLPKEMPNNQNPSRFAEDDGENFSDENHSPVRPMG